MSARTDELITPDLVEAIAGLARRGGDEILDVYAAGGATETKVDGSPVTEADTRAEAVIVAGLSQLTPEIPVLAEEKVSSGDIPDLGGGLFWLVDPLDGTKEFISRNGEFTVNIALVDDHRSVLGVVLAPVTGELYVGAAGQGAWLQEREGGAWRRIRTRPLGDPPRVVGSRSHGGTQGGLLEQLIGNDYDHVPLGSSLKFCLIARGEADIYLRLGLTSEWDTAAAQCVLDEAGGAVLDLAGRPFRYNRGESLLNPEFVAVGDLAIDWAARLARIEE